MKTTFVVLGLFALAFALKIAVNDGAGDACGRPCPNNNGCDQAGPCSFCDPADGFCKKGAVCGITCNTDGDCDQTGNCTICPRGHCASGGFCNQFCLSSEDCIGVCDLCTGGVCKAQCGGTCAEDKDCQYGGSSCGKCINQKCQVGGCFAQCSQDADCSREGNCTSCIDNHCSATCGGHCESDKECTGDFTGCGFCNPEGKCAPGTCHSQCQVGNNGGCNGSPTCTYCSVNTSTCEVGLPCYQKCAVNTDCDQSGECRLCSSHGFCVGAVEYEKSKHTK